MAISMPASITGAAVTGLTTPGYTMIADSAVDFNQKQSYVSALTGTQTGVLPHSVSSPFTVTVVKPKSFALLGKPDPITGLLRSVGRNTYKVLTRKGVSVAAAQPYAIELIRTELEIPAGAESYDIPNVRAAISAHIGALTAFSAGLSDTVVSGSL